MITTSKITLYRYVFKLINLNLRSIYIFKIWIEKLNISIFKLLLLKYPYFVTATPHNDFEIQ